MNSHNNFQSASFSQQQQSSYHSPNNPKHTVNLLMKKKSNLQQLNEQITSRTFDIKQHKSSRLKNYHSSNDYQASYHWPYQHNTTQKYSIRFSSPKSQTYKINYGPQLTYFNSPTKTPLYPQIKPQSSSKVNFFYDNPCQINTNNNKIDFQTPDSKTYTPIDYEPYKSTDFILFPNTNQSSIEKKNSIYKNVKFNYLNNTPVPSYPSQKSLKRTKSEEDFAKNSELKYEPKKSQYNKGRNKINDGDIFYDMNTGKTFSDKKNVSIKQKTSKQKVKQYQTPTKPSQVKTTQISSQKKPNIFQQYSTQLKAKQTRLIAVVLITLAVVIFIIQLTS